MKMFTTTTALLSAALISHAQTGATEGQEQRTTPPANQQSATGTQDQSTTSPGDRRAPGTTGATEPGQATTRGTEQANKDITAKLEKWSDAESEEIDMSNLPAQAKEAVRNIAADADIDDKVTRLTKDGEEVYCAKVTPEGQEEMEIFVSRDGAVQMAKQKATFEDLPMAVRNTITEHADNESPDDVYRILADSNTVYVAKAKDGNDKVKMITVSSTGQHIDTTSKDKGDKKKY